MEFADIALAKFLQTAPELGPFIVNFSEISDQMEGSITGTNVGIFILRAGNGIVTVPVIAKGETIFPIDSVFIENESKFKPLSSSTISYIVNTASSALGKVTDIPKTVDTNPNLQSLINPPRTGKFAYATSSRLVEFMAILPEHVKQFAFEKIANEQKVYNTLDKLFGLKAIFLALNGHNGGSGAGNNVSTGPSPNRQNTFSVITTPREVGELMNDSLAKTFLDQGYVVTGGSDSFRAAVAYQPFNSIGTYTNINCSVDGGKEFNIVMKDGSSKRAYIPIFSKLDKSSPIVIFEDGNYANSYDDGNENSFHGHHNLISSGDALADNTVLKNLFDLSPPKLLRDLSRDETFMLFLNSGEALGPFSANSVMRTANGTEVKTRYTLIHTIVGSNNFTKEAELIGSTLFVPNNVIVYVLGQDITGDAETNINNASKKQELIATQYLGAELDIRHDGIEFSANGVAVGGFPQALKILVEKENIEPLAAENFLKQAEVTKFVKLFLSKKASTTDFNPADVPQYGMPAPNVEEAGLNGSFLPAVQEAAELGDSQVLESTVIAQLLQVPELFEYIQEYLPEIEETVDKLGRILFLTRVKLGQISEALDSDSVFSMIAQIKNVYRQLGDMTLKLKGISQTSIGFDKEKVVGQTNGQ